MIRSKEGFITLLASILNEDVVDAMLEARFSLQSIAMQAVYKLFVYGNPLSSDADELKACLKTLEETGTWGFLL